MSKRTYRSVPVNDVSTAALELQPGERIIVAVDVAKVAFKAALIQGERLGSACGGLECASETRSGSSRSSLS
ncbi:MAG: hypothetical protein U1F43_26495 [Myxococcota bacterium]